MAFHPERFGVNFPFDPNKGFAPDQIPADARKRGCAGSDKMRGRRVDVTLPNSNLSEPVCNAQSAAELPKRRKAGGWLGGSGSRFFGNGMRF